MTRAATPENQHRDWYSIRNEDTTESPVEILIYDRIGESYWDDRTVSARAFVRDLTALDVDALTVRINSPGGNVYDGIAILNALRAHKATVTVYIDGIAASAASFVAMAGDEVIMSRNAEIMIHDAWSYASGDAEDLRKVADDLDRVSDNIARIYAERAGTDVEVWRAAMRAETWYSDAEAVEAGLADRVTAKSDDGDTAAAKASFDLSVFNYAGRNAAPAPRILAPVASAAPESSAADITTERGGSDVAFTDEQTSELREALSLPEDATQEQIYEALLERATAPAPVAAAPSLPDGVVTVEASVLDELRVAAERGAQARAQQETEARTALVSAAIKDGRIASARRDHWLAALAADPDGAAATLASLAPGLVPVDEIGHGVGVENANQDLGWFDSTSTKEA
ncbi:head maturation protease, ClpP-related [Rhodococcus sp. 11-3]|uniref:head maturation protease, ClpP-related n=1 Tax=Rhodococcus sp. 11-3 TaxID=2854796 RepID=UPI002041C79E|nr:head maturation protease, ClpP-related [Rhodococcus sp. 11-3]